MSYILIFTNPIDGLKGTSFKKNFHFSMSDFEYLFICLSAILTSVFVDCLFSQFFFWNFWYFIPVLNVLYILVILALCDIVSYF